MNKTLENSNFFKIISYYILLPLHRSVAYIMFYRQNAEPLNITINLH